MAETTLLEKFSKIFLGNTTFYVKHQAPFTLEESGKMKAAWCGFAKDKKTKEFLPVTIETYRNHLKGKDGLALSPIMDIGAKRNVCFFAVIDIDVYGVTYTTLVQKLYQYGFNFVPFLSKSGGLHIYFFFSDAESADKVIETLSRIVTIFGLNRLYTTDKGKSKVEIFPKQASIVPGESQGNAVMLPFYDAENKSRQALLTPEGKLIQIEKAIPIIENKFTTLKAVNDCIDVLPYSDAPFCIQMILLTGALGENSGRNDFLFSVAVYLKKKLKENILDSLREANECLETPLPDEDLVSIETSVMKKEWHLGCSKAPCSEYCDKKLCKLREWGPGRDRGGHYTGADCWGYIYRVLSQEPYYLWEVRVKPEDEFKQIRIDGEADLMNQNIVQRSCIRDLNWSPFRVKENDWIAQVNTAMEGLTERLIEVPEETDTTELSTLRSLFMQYLTHKQVQSGQPYKVNLGQVYRKDSVYYFAHSGFIRYLGTQRFVLGRLNLRAMLIQYGCCEGEVEYETSTKQKKTIKCWKKEADEQLSGMEEFFEDIYDGDSDVLKKNKLNKIDTGKEAGDEITRF